MWVPYSCIHIWAFYTEMNLYVVYSGSAALMYETVDRTQLRWNWGLTRECEWLGGDGLRRVLIRSGFLSGEYPFDLVHPWITELRRGGDPTLLWPIQVPLTVTGSKWNRLEQDSCPYHHHIDSYNSISLCIYELLCMCILLWRILVVGMEAGVAGFMLGVIQRGFVDR